MFGFINRIDKVIESYWCVTKHHRQLLQQALQSTAIKFTCLTLVYQPEHQDYFLFGVIFT